MKWEKLLQEKPFTNKFAIIPGGSKGIGKAIAKNFIQLGGSAVILARNKEILEETRSEIEQFCGENQFIDALPCDCTHEEEVEEHFKKIMDAHGVPDYLFSCIGYAHPGYITDLRLEDFRRNMEVNYFGVITPVLKIIPHFIKRKRGHIAVISSAMGYFGMMGYATYAPTKFALVGFMESLRNELSIHNIKCSILYPTDTKTPGFDEENKLKPIECAIMSESGKLFTPDQIARVFLQGILKEKFHILPGPSKLFYHFHRLWPSMFYRILDSEYKSAIKKAAKLKQERQ